ncbi:MAG: TonB-dependent receptor [Cyclobacteriaceae bacterium]
MSRLIIIVSVLISIAVAAHGQEAPPAPDGAIEEVQVIIEKDREIILPFANRYFEKVNLENSTIQPGSLQFDFEERTFEPGRIEVGFTPQSYQTQSRTLSNQSFIKLGYGNYGSPLLQANAYTNTSSDWLLGVDLDHLSFGSGAVDDENSAGGRSALNLTGSRMSENSTFTGRLGYNTRNGYYYGYPEETIINDRDSIEQIFNEFRLGLDWSGRVAEEGSLSLVADFNLINDEYDVSENKFSAGIKTALPLTDMLNLELGLSGVLSQYTNGIGDYKRNLYTIQPGVAYQNEALKLKVGAQLAIVDEDSSLNENFNIYPDVRLDYNVSEVVNFYVGVGGGIRQQYFESRARENFFIGDSTNIQHASEQWQGFVGIAANSQKLSFDLNARYGQIDNMGYFVNRASNPSEFDLIYDTGITGLLTIGATVGYAINDNIIAELGAKFYNYSTDSLPVPYHVPELEAFFNIKTKLADQWTLGVQGQFMGGVTGANLVEDTSFDLDAFFDLSVELDYQIDEHWGAFIMVDNVLSQDYSRYYRYPNRQLMAKLGVSYSF